MAIQWFYRIGNEVFGPVSPNEIREKAAIGEILPNTPIRKGPDGRWVRAEKVRGLFQRNDSLSAPAVPPEKSHDLLTPPPLPPPKSVPTVDGTNSECAVNGDPQEERSWLCFFQDTFLGRTLGQLVVLILFFFWLCISIVIAWAILSILYGKINLEDFVVHLVDISQPKTLAGKIICVFWCYLGYHFIFNPMFSFCSKKNIPKKRKSLMRKIGKFARSLLGK